MRDEWHKRKGLASITNLSYVHSLEGSPYFVIKIVSLFFYFLFLNIFLLNEIYSIYFWKKVDNIKFSKRNLVIKRYGSMAYKEKMLENECIEFLSCAVHTMWPVCI